MNKLVFEESVYTYHIDFSRHVSNIVYIQWMEIGRLKLLDSIGMPVHEMAEKHGILPVLTETEISYKKFLLLGDKVRIEVWLSELKKISATIEFRFFRGVDLIAVGQQKGLFINALTQRPHRLSQEDRARLELVLPN